MPNSFILFKREKTDEIRESIYEEGEIEEGLNIPVALIAKKAGAMWRELGEEENKNIKIYSKN